MTKKIITISREFGSGGRFIGEEVAQKLGIAYYDKDIIGQIAEQSGLSPKSYLLRKVCLPMPLQDVTLPGNRSRT